MFAVYPHPDIPHLSPTRIVSSSTHTGVLRNLSWRPLGPRSCSVVTPAGPYTAGSLAELLPPLIGGSGSRF